MLDVKKIESNILTPPPVGGELAQMRHVEIYVRVHGSDDQSIHVDIGGKRKSMAQKFAAWATTLWDGIWK